MVSPSSENANENVYLSSSYGFHLSGKKRLWYDCDTFQLLFWDVWNPITEARNAFKQSRNNTTRVNTILCSRPHNIWWIGQLASSHHKRISVVSISVSVDFMSTGVNLKHLGKRFGRCYGSGPSRGWWHWKIKVVVSPSREDDRSIFVDPPN